MPKTVHSPRKYAPIFSPTTQHLKRKTPDCDGNVSALDENDIADPKRLCADVNIGESWANSEETNLMSANTVNVDNHVRPIDDTNVYNDPKLSHGEVGSAEVTNVMILQAITSLTQRIDGIEAKIIAKVDAKLQDFRMEAQDSEKRFDTRLRQLEDDIHNNFEKLDTELDDRMSELENARVLKFDEATEARIDRLERLARANELVISGVPQTENENLIKICDSICGAIGFNGNNSIQSCFRVPLKSINSSSSNNSNRQFSPSIITKFWSCDAKSEFFKSYIANKNLCVTNIGFSTPGRIYINDNLTKKNFEIYRLARQLKADGKLFQYHTFSGRISVKLNENSRQVGIDSKDQLNSLIYEDNNTAQQRHRKQPNKRQQNQNQQPLQLRKNTRTSQQKNQQPKHQPNQQPNHHPNQQKNQQLNQQTNQQPNQQTNQQSNQRQNHQPNKQPNHQPN